MDIYIYIDIQIERQTYRQIDRQIDRQTDRQRESHTLSLFLSVLAVYCSVELCLNSHDGLQNKDQKMHPNVHM